MTFPKTKRVQLHGVALKKLVEAVYERDNGCCVNCGRYVPEGTKPHHVIFKSRCGSDEENNLVMLCNDCHYAVHHGKGGNAVQEKCERVLKEIYGD